MRPVRVLVPVWLLAACVAARADDAPVPDGRIVFERSCAACHAAGGKGTPGLAPALAGPLAPLLRQDEGRHYLAQVLTHGLSGRIVSQGQTFVGAMPSQVALSDAELASVASYLMHELNGVDAPPLSGDDYARVRAVAVTHKELRDLRQRLMP